MKRSRGKTPKPPPEPDSRGDSDMHLCLLCSKKIQGLGAYVQHRQNGCKPDSSSSQSSDSKSAAEGTASTTVDSASSLSPPTKSKSVIRRCKECGIDFKSRRSHAEHMDLAHRSPLFTPSCSRGERKFSKRKTAFKTAVDHSLWSGGDPVDDDDAIQSDSDEFGEVEASISVDINVEAVANPTTAKRERAYIEGRSEEWIVDQDPDSKGFSDSEIIEEELCEEEMVECPLCGPISATGLAAHIFSPGHITSYKAFRGKVLPLRLGQDFSSSAINSNFGLVDGGPDAANTASHLVGEGASALTEGTGRADDAATVSDHAVLDVKYETSESSTEPSAVPVILDVKGGSRSPQVLLMDRTDDCPNMEVVVCEPVVDIAAGSDAFTSAATDTEMVQGDITPDSGDPADVKPADDADKALRLEALTLSGVVWSAPFAPFRCHPCRFSCNRLSDLRRHAGSQGHWLRRSEKRCSLCRGDVAGPEHFDDDEHRAGASRPLSILGVIPYHCGVCSVSLRLRAAAVSHLRRRHDAAGAYVCDTCGAALPQRDAAAHQAHHGLPQRCDTCGKLLTTPRAVEKHFRSSLCQYPGYIRGGKIKCRHCSFRNNLKVNVLFHEAVSHLPTQTDSARPERGRRGSKSASSRKTGLRYLCPECDVYFRKSTLKPHLMKHTGEAPYHCIYCSRYFYVESECERHERLSHRHRRDEEQRSVAKATLAGVPRAAYYGLKCQLCGEGFSTGTALRMHERRKHRGEQRLCPVSDCDFQTRNATLLSRHLVKSHPQFRRFRCQLCDFACTTSAALETHSYKHSGLKPYRCEHCEFATRFPAHLKRHLRIHTGARPYPCPFCEYKANNFENLRKHVISTGRHQGLSVYMCKFCPEGALFGTNFAREFKQHLRQQHAGEFKSVGALATYVAGLYNEQDDIIETDQPIDHTYRQRSQTAKPRRAVVRRVRASPAGTSLPRLPTMAVTVMPVKGYRATRTNRLPLLAPRGKTALLSPADAVLAVAKQREAEGAAAVIDCEDVPDAVTLQVVPPDCTLGDVSEHQFTAPPLGRGSWQRPKEEEVDDPAEPAVGPTRFSGDATMTEAPVPQVHVEDAAVRSSVHRTTLVKSSADSPDSEIISLETNFPTEITAVHSEETGDCSSLLMTFLTDRGSRHVMVPRDVIIHKPGAPVFSRIRVDFVPGDTEGTDKVTIHRFC